MISQTTPLFSSTLTQYDHITIIGARQTGQQIIQLAKTWGALGGTIMKAWGTVSNELMITLGIKDNHREHTTLLAHKHHSDRIVALLAMHLHLDKPNHGIIYIEPVSGTMGINALYRLMHPGSEQPVFPKIDMEVTKYMNIGEYELITVIVKRGFADKAMHAARAHGAEGGTILNGRGVGVHETAMLFGVPIEPEKDILKILIEKDKCDEVMKSIIQEVGLSTPGQGIAYVTPVTRVMGIAHKENK